MNEEAKVNEEKVIPTVTESQYEMALSDMQRQLKEQEPATISLLNELHTRTKSIYLTILQNFPPEGHLKLVIDFLFSAAGLIELSLDFYGSGAGRIKFDDPSTNEVEDDVNPGKPVELHGGQVKKLKEIRLLIMSLAMQMDKVGHAMTHFEAQRMLGQARNDIHRAIIFNEEMLRSVGFILVQERPRIIPAGSIS